MNKGKVTSIFAAIREQKPRIKGISSAKRQALSVIFRWNAIPPASIVFQTFFFFFSVGGSHKMCQLKGCNESLASKAEIFLQRNAILFRAMKTFVDTACILDSKETILTFELWCLTHLNLNEEMNFSYRRANLWNIKDILHTELCVTIIKLPDYLSPWKLFVIKCMIIQKYYWQKLFLEFILESGCFIIKEMNLRTLIKNCPSHNKTC